MRTFYFRFSFCDTFFPNECTGLCQHRLGHSLGDKIKVAPNENNYIHVFCIPKICQILKQFVGAKISEE